MVPLGILQKKAEGETLHFRAILFHKRPCIISMTILLLSLPVYLCVQVSAIKAFPGLKSSIAGARKGMGLKREETK